MQSSKKLANFGIDKINHAILRQIQKRGEIQPYPLSKSLPLPRTTINYRLGRLERNGWIRRISVGRRFAYTLTHQSRQILRKEPLEETQSIGTFFGLDQIREIIEGISKDPSKERGYFIEPSRQSISMYQKLGSEESKNLQDIMQKSGRVFEGIASEETVSVLKNQNPEYVHSMYGRPIELYVVPDALLEVSETILVFRNRVYIMDIVNNNYVEIVSDRLATIFKTMIQTLKFQGRKFNLNTFIETLKHL